MLLRICVFVVVGLASLRAAETSPGAVKFHSEIRPLLERYCYDCHGDGEDKGNVAFDAFKSNDELFANKHLWSQALKNLEAGLMPPARKSKPTDEERELIARWIKDAVFELDPAHPDPGRVTLRRLNRVEYRNTIAELMGIDYNTQEAFPADDTGHGFDNIADVLTVSPLLLEKYLIAANAIVARAVPTFAAQVPESRVSGRRFQGVGHSRGEGPLQLSFYEHSSVSNTITVPHDGDYELVLTLAVQDRTLTEAFDHNRCRLGLMADGKEVWSEEFSWEGYKAVEARIPVAWKAGKHDLSLELEALTPGESNQRMLLLRVDSVLVRGPMARKFWVAPANYKRFFSKPVPDGLKAQQEYARELLADFASRAFRRPVDARTVDRLVSIAESTWSQGTFEAGVAQAMVAVLASPRFLFRVEEALPVAAGDKFPLIDEFALASRLSYFLWSSMPDEELFRLAREGRLREQLPAQTARLMKDRRSQQFIRNFTGQWLQARDVDHAPIDARTVLNRDRGASSEAERMRRRLNQLRDKGDARLSMDERRERDELRDELARQARLSFSGELRRSMRTETERFFEHVIREDRPLLELIDSDYTFLNEVLARHYGITNVNGSEIRKVNLPADSPRGGVLTHGSVLAVTSNPTRTSPVKRGVFILDNILGTPPPPPPPDIPSLDEAATESGKRLTLRESLARHREDAMCSSCHNRMDPLGLAFENFNALGMWREREQGEPIDATGKLVTGETFTDVRELKKILASNHARQFYRTMTEKLLTYALGRGMEYYDTATIDHIVERVERANGRSSELLAGVIESAAFQRVRVGKSTSHAATDRKDESSVAGTTALTATATRKGNP